MRSRFLTATLFLCAVVPFAQLACGSEAETRYGGPSGLSKRQVPPIPGEGSATAAPAGSGGLCDPSTGQSTVEGGTCTVSWANDIYPKMLPTGVWQCANTACHGPTASGQGPNSPTIDGTNGATAYAALVAFSIDNTNPYINACSTDPSASDMDANLKGNKSSQMPTQGTGVSPSPATAADITTLETWLACGAPLN